MPTFKMAVKYNGVMLGEGSDSGKDRAKEKAAKHALERLKILINKDQ